MFISDQNVKPKAIGIETAFIHSLGNPKGRTLDHSRRAEEPAKSRHFLINMSVPKLRSRPRNTQK